MHASDCALRLPRILNDAMVVWCNVSYNTSRCPRQRVRLDFLYVRRCQIHSRNAVAQGARGWLAVFAVHKYCRVRERSISFCVRMPLLLPCPGLLCFMYFRSEGSVLKALPKFLPGEFHRFVACFVVRLRDRPRHISRC